MKKEYKVDKSIYPDKHINIAISDFKDVSDIKYNNWIVIILGDNEAEIEEVFNEFINYTIWLINE